MTSPKKDQQPMGDQSSSPMQSRNDSKENRPSTKSGDALLMNDDETEREDDSDQLDSMADNRAGNESDQEEGMDDEDVFNDDDRDEENGMRS